MKEKAHIGNLTKWVQMAGRVRYCQQVETQILNRVVENTPNLGPKQRNQ